MKTRILLNALSLSASVTAIAVAMLVLPQAALAQSQAGPNGPEGSGVEEITVTGTNIRGAAPIGSHVATLDQTDMEAIAPVSVTGVLTALPQLSTSGTAPQGENSYTFYSPNIHNVAASASNSTLVVVDGMRIPGGGSQWAESDPNIIPVAALQRVEVLADGASSVYGSDAVSGVVNFITRKSFDGLQVDGQVGFGNSYQTDNADILWGTHWDTGNVYAAASYTFGTNIPLSSRAFATMGDFTSVGGNNQKSASCSPASIHPTAPVAGSGGNYFYAGPNGAAFANTQAARPCNLEIYGDIIPQVQRSNAMVKVSQDFFGGRLNISETLLYNDLHTFQQTGPGTISGAAAYGNGSGKGGQINPFFQAPAGAPATTAEQVSWVNLLSPLPQSISTEDVIYNRFTASFAITDNWHFDLDWVLGQNNYASGTVNGFCSSCAYLALNGTGLSNGSTTQTDVAGSNIIALNTPLTPSNALDVWNPVGSNLTSANVIRSLSSYNAITPIYNSTNQVRGTISGSLFALPAGDLKVALGGEVYVQHITKDQVSSDNTGPSATSSEVLHYRYHRVVQSGYVEFQVPLISPEMGVPFVQKLSADVSGRIDSFSDVGTTSNPKYALDWQVDSDLKLRANYSTSFVAPPLLSLGDPAYGYTYQGGASTGGEIDNIPAANFPGIQNIPGAVCTVNGGASATPASSGCPFVTLGNTPGTGGTGGNQGLERQYGGLFVNVKPETGISWSIGADYNPSWLQGFHSSITLWNTTFKGAVNAAHIQQTENVPSLFHFLQICNNGLSPCTAAQINAFTNTGGGAPIGTVPAGAVNYLWAHDETNFLYLRVQGIDFDGQYTMDAGDLGTFHLGDDLTLFTQYKEGYDGLNYFSILGTSGFNGTFSSLEYNNRLNAGWITGPFALDVWVNYMPGYHNWNSTSVTPLNPNALGVPTAGDKVSSWTTLDMNLAYNFESGWLGGDQVYVHVNNLLDTDPPFINTTANGAGASSGAAFGFNAFNASPIGRTVELGLRAKF